LIKTSDVILKIKIQINTNAVYIYFGQTQQGLAEISMEDLANKLADAGKLINR
jgi:hypothetical protein